MDKGGVQLFSRPNLIHQRTYFQHVPGQEGNAGLLIMAKLFVWTDLEFECYLYNASRKSWSYIVARGSYY